MSLSVTLYDESGVKISPRAPISFSLIHSMDTPVDSLKAVFLEEPCFSREMAAVEIHSTERTLFSGLIDEQELQISSSGKWVTLTGRSRAALLCDNEALPGQYLETKLDSIFERHVKPYGFSFIQTEEQLPLPSFLVAKGESELDVLIRFCLLSGYPAPRFTADNRMVVSRRNAGRTFYVSNTAQGAIPFLSIFRKLARHTCISEIFLKNQDGIYSTAVENPYALLHGIRRRRYLSPANEWAVRGDLDAKRRIAASMYNRLAVETQLPGLHAAELGDNVFLDDGTTADLYSITGIKWQRKEQGDSTLLILSSPELWTESGGIYDVAQ